MDFQPSMFSPAIINVHTVYFTHTPSLKAKIYIVLPLGESNYMIIPKCKYFTQQYTNTLSNETQK